MAPYRGDVVHVGLRVPVGHEVGYEQPALVVSHDRMAATGLMVVCAITRTRHGWPSHVEVEPSESGLPEVSYAQTEQVRTVSTLRLARVVGRLDPLVLSAVDGRLRTDLALP